MELEEIVKSRKILTFMNGMINHVLLEVLELMIANEDVSEPLDKEYLIKNFFNEGIHFEMYFLDQYVKGNREVGWERVQDYWDFSQHIPILEYREM